MPKEKDVVTVATIREGKDGEEILFNERQQIFTLPPKAKSFASFAPSFDPKKTVKQNTPFEVILDPKKGVVESMQPAGDKKAAQFTKDRTLLEGAAKPMRMTAALFDPTTASVDDLKAEAIKAEAMKAIKGKAKKAKAPAGAAAAPCMAVIPNVATAQTIFNYMANQACYLPGPFAYPPCIPFQYVRDGCYARAHKMRQILLNKYNYCCQKIFSFANTGNYKLAVKADKWGGCCVTWWYHVAPLVCVYNPTIYPYYFYMVLDPGMFNGPVIWNYWLAAQQTTACYAAAKVTMYSVQPDTAYAPANYAGTSFTTDPNYTATNQTLIAYKNLKTC